MRLMVSESMMQAHGSRTAESSHLDDIGSHTHTHTHTYKRKKREGKKHRKKTSPDIEWQLELR